MFKKSYYACFLFLALQSSILAQTSQKPDSVEFAFLPAISFNSDLGFIFGGITDWYTYRDGIDPFYTRLTISGVLSTKGLATFEVTKDKPKAFGTDIRITTSIYTFRFLEDSYFGFRNYANLKNKETFPTPYFTFQSFSLGLNTTLRLPLTNPTSNKGLDALAIVNLNYETPFDNSEEQFFTIEKPTGFNGGRTFQLGTGIIWEARNNEFNPTKGAYIKSSIEVGNSIWGSSFDNVILEHQMSYYSTFHLIKDITFANRLYTKHTSGDVPYWKLAYAGDDETLRGYPAKRFLDDNATLLNSELRTWLLEFPDKNMKFGGTLFIDAGRTFRNGEAFSEIIDDLKYSYGFGGTASFFSPNFIIRGDVGFSEEGTGVYITTGYLF